MTKPLRLIFAGTPEFAAQHLQAIIDAKQHEVIAVYSQPDRPAGRGKKLQASPVKSFAVAHSIPVFQPENFKSDQAVAELAALGADLMVVVAYGLLLPQRVLDTPRLGCINVHASLLPRWRGAAPVQRAIEAGDAETGVTIMQMDIGLDTGTMLSKVSCRIEPSDTSASLLDKLAELGGPALNAALNAMATADVNGNRLHGEIQNDADTCYASKISKEEAEIDWREPAELIARKIRAFNPFPVSYTWLEQDRLKIQQATPTNESGPAGEILRADADGIVVACGENALVITQLQLPGARPMNPRDMLNARADRFQVGTQLGGHA